MNSIKEHTDWGQAALDYEAIKQSVKNIDLSSINEAQTRFDIIDRIIREVLCWRHGNIKVEERFHDASGERYVDYVLSLGDITVVVEAKRSGAAFPNFTKRKRLKLSGTVLSSGEIFNAIEQIKPYTRDVDADIAVVTNGMCWCLFFANSKFDNGHAKLFFPFEDISDAEKLFCDLSYNSIAQFGISHILDIDIYNVDEKLITIIRDADGRVDRNNIADHIVPALNNALYAESISNNPTSLERCFITTEARTKFDSQLNMHIADPKPASISPAPRIKRSNAKNKLHDIVATTQNRDYAPPVTLIIGPVGAGKSTYLKHFEKISGRSTLENLRAAWINIDFESMGKAGLPRKFIYQQLKEYINTENSIFKTDYANLVAPAYEKEISALAKGPFGFLDKQSPEFKKVVTDLISKDYENVEPYIDKLLTYISNQRPCIIILDNVDLYEDNELEKSVFSEGLSLSKRVKCHVIVSLRDRTYVRHKNESVFDAYELRKLWIDPPPLKEVLSTRLEYSKQILKHKRAEIYFVNDMHFTVNDLSVFFDIVQKSILGGNAGDFIESMAGLNIRRGLDLVSNFLTSGHIQADRALKAYINGDTKYIFPFHEVFKGAVLGQWRHYKEERAEVINIFDSKLGVKRLRLIRLHILMYLSCMAQSSDTMHVQVAELISLFTKHGGTEEQILGVLTVLLNNALISSEPSGVIIKTGAVACTKCGGYLTKVLATKFVYAEACLIDTAIEDKEYWERLSDITLSVENERNIARRMELRYERIEIFLNYCLSLEQQILENNPNKTIDAISEIKKNVLTDANVAKVRAQRNYG